MNPGFPTPPVLSPSPRLETITEYLSPPSPLDFSKLPAVPELPAEPLAGLESQANPAPRELLARHIPEIEVITVELCPAELDPQTRIQPNLIDEPLEVASSEATEQATLESIEPLEPPDSLEALLRPMD